MEKTELMNDALVLQDNEEAVDNNEVLAQDMDFDEIKARTSPAHRYLTFELDGEHYGVKIDYVIEIVGIQDITQLPGTPKYVKGLINLRGKIIPLIDAREKFGKEKAEYNDRTCIVVLDIDDIMVGLVVDVISDVINIYDSDIEEAPNIGKIKANKYIKDIAKIDKKVKLLIDCEKLINE